MEIKVTKVLPSEVHIPEIECPECKRKIQSLQFLVFDSGTGICPSCNTAFRWRKTYYKKGGINGARRPIKNKSITDK